MTSGAPNFPRRVRITRGFYAGHTGVATRRTLSSGRLVVRVDKDVGHGRQALAVLGEGEYEWVEVREGEDDGQQEVGRAR